MSKINKKLMLVTSSALVVLIVFVLVGLWLFNSSTQKTSASNLYHTVINEHYALDSDLTICQGGTATSDGCLLTLFEYSSAGLMTQINFIDQGKDSIISGALDKAQASSSKGKWKDTEKEILAAINQKNELVAKYISTNMADVKNIHKLLVPGVVSNINNYYINGPWAIVSTSSTETDPANTLLKRSNNVWAVAVGPGTSFSQEEMSNLGVPNTVATRLQIVYGATIIDFAGLTKNVSGETISSIVNTNIGQDFSVLSLSSKLPINTDTYSLRADSINNKPTYVSTIYFSNEADKLKNKDAVLAWFTTNGAKTAALPIQFEYLQNSTDE